MFVQQKQQSDERRFSPSCEKPHTRYTTNVGPNLYLGHSLDTQNKAHNLGKAVNQLDATQKEFYAVFLAQHVSGINMPISRSTV
jgi:hypothetical protein